MSSIPEIQNLGNIADLVPKIVKFQKIHTKSILTEFVCFIFSFNSTLQILTANLQSLAVLHFPL